MPLRVHCPVCGYRIKAPDGSYGRRGQCPRCKLMIRLPTAAEIQAGQARQLEQQEAERLGDSGAESTVSPAAGGPDDLVLDDDA